MNQSFTRTAPIAVVVMMAAASCTRAPSDRGPTLHNVELIVPRTLAPGAMAQLRLIARLSDGSTRDVTSSATFRSSSEAVVTVSREGLASARAVGDALIDGFVHSYSNSQEVVVVPEGTFRVVGRVFEEGYSDLPVGGVRVEAVGGGPSDSTELDGGYRLYGVPGQARLRLSKNGYLTQELSLAISDHHTENVLLVLVGPRDVAGAYQLTVEAAAECRGQMPDATLGRRYAATLTQPGDAVQIQLNGANLVHAALGASLRQNGLALEFVSEPQYYGHCENWNAQFVEKIDDATYFVVYGIAGLLPTGQGFAGTLDGRSMVYRCAPCSFSCSNRPYAECTSNRVTMTRR